MRLMREGLSESVRRHAMPPVTGRSGRQRQLEWIAALPASREAERLLALPGVGTVGRDPLLPALLVLLEWALEDVSGLDKSRARAVWEDLMQMDLRGEPGAAVLALLSCGDPEHEIPPELLARSPEEAAAGIVSLAASASWGLPRASRRQFPTVRA